VGGPERFGTETKSSQVDPVTGTDRDTQARIVSAIGEQSPDDAVVAEEGDARKTVPRETYAWILHPTHRTPDPFPVPGPRPMRAPPVAAGRQPSTPR
jgi:hypothetical protein